LEVDAAAADENINKKLKIVGGRTKQQQKNP
jgi:hypothetical protein